MLVQVVQDHLLVRDLLDVRLGAAGAAGQVIVGTTTTTTTTTTTQHQAAKAGGGAARHAPNATVQPNGPQCLS